MISYYIQRGHSLSELLGLTRLEKLFLFASINLAREEEQQKYEALFGGAK